jgi:hypothetical protein
MAISVHNAFEGCRQALGATHEELGAMVGVSLRAAQRWTNDGIPSHAMIDLSLAAPSQSCAGA